MKAVSRTGVYGSALSGLSSAAKRGGATRRKRSTDPERMCSIVGEGKRQMPVGMGSELVFEPVQVLPGTGRGRDGNYLRRIVTVQFRHTALESGYAFAAGFNEQEMLVRVLNRALPSVDTPHAWKHVYTGAEAFINKRSSQS